MRRGTLRLLKDWVLYKGEKICENEGFYYHGKDNDGDAKIRVPCRIKWHMFYTRMCTMSDDSGNLFCSRFPNKLTQQKYFHIKQTPKDFFFFFFCPKVKAKPSGTILLISLYIYNLLNFFPFLNKFILVLEK